jgi:hypothetical protein
MGAEMGLLELIAEDARATFYNGEFAEAISVSDGVVDAEILGIVDMTHQEVDMETGVAVMSVKPRVSLWLADVPFALKQGHVVTMRAREYAIRDVEQQGDGSAIVELNG